jgi:hypothetical protein
VSAVIQDLAHAARTLTRRPAFTAVAVGTIALFVPVLRRIRRLGLYSLGLQSQSQRRPETSYG